MPAERHFVRSSSSRLGFAASVKALSSPRLSPEEQRRARRLHRWRGYLLVASCVLAAVGMATGIAAAQLVFWRCQLDADLDTCPGRLRDATTDALKAATTASTVALLLVLLAFRVVQVAEKRLGGSLLPHESVFATDIPLRAAAGMLLCALHCPAGVYRTVRVESFSVTVTYDFDSLLAIALAMRGFVLFPLVIEEFAGLRTPSARVIERFNGVKVDVGYTLRLLMERAPLAFSFIMFTSTVMIAAFALHVAERPVCQSEAAIDAGWCAHGTMGVRDFSSFANSMWNAIITALTVGYGDIYAMTQFGRGIASLTALAGTMALAILINATARAVELSPAEARASRAFMRVRQHGNKRRIAALVVRGLLKVARHRLPRGAAAAATAAAAAATAAAEAGSSAGVNVSAPAPKAAAASAAASTAASEAAKAATSGSAEEVAAAAAAAKAAALAATVRAARREAWIACLRPLGEVPAEAQHALASAVHQWKIHLRDAQRSSNNISDVIRLQYDMIDLRESIDKNFRFSARRLAESHNKLAEQLAQSEARLVRHIERLEAASAGGGAGRFGTPLRADALQHFSASVRLDQPGPPLTVSQ
jgi:hypothetical protein